MDLTSIGEYLTGAAFSHSLKLRISSAESSIPFRMETIEHIVEKKNTIHFGCADHIDIIETKIAKNIWFHKRLLACTRRCIGIDINKDAVDFMVSKLHIGEVYCMDIEREEIPPDITAGHFEYLIMGEIIEHIDNPVQFLKTVHAKFGTCAERIIVTAPNAFRWNNFRNVLKNQELINSDHRYWFSPYTLSKVMNRAGFQHIDFQLVENNKPGKYAMIRKSLFRLFPAFRDTILLQADF